MGKIQYYLKNNTRIADEHIDQISRCFRLQHVKKNTLLLSEGETCKDLYFVHRGSIRTYFVTARGQEKTRHIAFEDAIITSISSFISQKKSTEFVETLENSELYAINHKDFYQLLSDIPLWGKYYRLFLESTYLCQNQKMENRITLSAKQRYDKLMSEEPIYIQRLSNRILASYLDITQETLSRLKSK